MERTTKSIVAINLDDPVINEIHKEMEDTGASRSWIINKVLRKHYKLKEVKNGKKTS